MKLTEKEKNAIVNEALFNLGVYFASDERGQFEDSSTMEHIAMDLIEEIWVPDSEQVAGALVCLHITKESEEALNDMMAQILTFIESNGDVRDWLIQILNENRLQSLYEEAYEISKYEHFDTEEERKKALEPIEKRIEQLNAEAETMKEAWDCFKKIKYGDKTFESFL